MGVPTHGLGCTCKAYWLTKCKHCGDEVRYFECSCGSKVFFEPGTEGTWVKHECLEGLLAYIPKDFLEQAMAEQMMRPGIPRPAPVRRAAVEQAVKKPPPCVARWEPVDGVSISGDGIVREIVEQPNLRKAAGVDKQMDLDNPVAAAFIAPLAPGMAQVTVEMGDLESGTATSCTGFVSADEYASSSVARGSLVYCSVLGAELASGATVWLFKDLGEIR